MFVALVAMLWSFALSASVEVTSLAELQAALAEDNELPIIITETIVIPEGETVTIDLNGKTVTVPETTGKHIYALNNKGSLTLKDTKGNGSITARGIYTGYNGTSTDETVAGAKMTIESGKYIGMDTDGGAAIFNCAELVVNGGDFTGGVAAINNRKMGDATIKGGTFHGGNNYVLQNNGGQLTIDDATVDSGFGAVGNYSGTTVINDGTYLPTGRANATCHVVYVAGAADVTINGGTFKMNYPEGSTPDSGSAVASYYNGILSITGGTFYAHFDNVSPVELSNGATINGGTYLIHSGAASNHPFVKNYLAEGLELGEDGTAVLTEYPAGVTATDFGDNTVTDGTNYYATLQAAVEAVAGQANAVLYCKPGADVGSLQHAPVVSTLTIYGNGANVTGGSERDFDLGNTDPSVGKDITADMTLTVKNLDGCGAWGAKATEHTVNLVFENCANMGKVFITGTTGTLNITMNDCAFEGVLKEAVYSNANGAITLNNVAFSNLNKAINLNHKVAGTQTVTINGCSFTNCGADVAADQIPVRVLSSVEGGKSVLTVSNTTFTGTPEGGADILLDYGVGESALNITETAANVSVEIKEGVATTTTVSKSDEQQTFTNAAPVSGLTGEGSAASPYLINNVDDLILFRNSVNAGETTYNAEGVYVALGADIDLTDQDWSVNIGDDCNATFDGIFDGKGFTISNLTSTETAKKADGYICTGLFGAIAGNAVVKNLTIENVTIDAQYVGNNVGAVVGFAWEASGSIENVTVTGDININASAVTGVGAILGYDYACKSLEIKDCKVIGTEGSSIVGGKAYVGGVVGYASSKIALNGNTVENVTVTGTASVGAIAGIMLVGSSAADNTVKSVAVSATGELWANSAAVVAGTMTSDGTVTISNTTVEDVTINGTEFDDNEEDAYASVIVGGKLVEQPKEPIAKVEAKIGDIYYVTFDAAMAAQGNDDVVLLVEKAITLDDEKAYTYTKGAYDVNVKYKRTLIAGIWNPVYLPFDFDLASDEFEVAVFTSAEGATVTLTKLEANEYGNIDLFANTAYVVRPIGENTTLDLGIIGLISKNEEKVQDLYNGFSVRGNYSKLTGADLEDNDRVVNGKTGNWGVLMSESYLKPFRLILSVPKDFTPEQSAAISMRVLDNTTGVEETIMDGQEALVIFDVMGRRVESITEGGIYIVNGKKIVF